jgi:hypothetical protein
MISELFRLHVTGEMSAESWKSLARKSFIASQLQVNMLPSTGYSCKNGTTVGCDFFFPVQSVSRLSNLDTRWVDNYTRDSCQPVRMCSWRQRNTYRWKMIPSNNQWRLSMCYSNLLSV